MRFTQACMALMSLSSLAASAPTDALMPASNRGLKWRSRRAPLTIEQIVQETNIIVIQNNQAQLDALQRVAEQEFAALVQAQVALITQLQDVKNNIRLNHFKARFSQVNTVIVTVSTVIDARAGKNNQKRYMVNQQLVDNGKPESQIMVMVSDAQTMTLGASQTVDLAGVAAATAVAQPSAAPAQIVNQDPNAPFGSINQNLLLPIGAQAPSVDLVFVDPAAIILPNQKNLFIESTDTFLQDCGFYQSNNNAFANLGSQTFTSFEQITVANGAVSIVKQQQNQVNIIV
ncbi:uncharacterized protein GGS22DRAFT_186316 [Annulohypoxylon maeteangense]|uniref:uncharacterized protein n=1 Tax=Annulohypoxylon maeteangense TaxID=1927788 RepID=UPI0020087203|nr:uncharacterized protein GGS22DRAFT_186316 [Annulohypoxylon maeteangense]KAI0887484.1 hypothetical protein GGS22DRAFT_186316 [Annulohypoxylon maeteangense]